MKEQKKGIKLKYKFLILLISTLISTHVFAYISSDGDEFIVKHNKHGAVLTSVHEKYYWVGIGIGAGATPAAKKVIIYLGKSCDISSDFYGKGSWAKANGGFILTFSDKELAFARQEIAIENNGNCRM